MASATISSALAAPVVLACLGLAGCLPLADTNSCAVDDECPSDEICTDVKECSLQAAAPSWRIAWTINGESPSTNPSVCDGVALVVLTVTSSTESLSYAPLVCTAGAFGFSAIPTGFNTARVELQNEFDQTMAQARNSGTREAGAELVIDLEL